MESVREQVASTSGRAPVRTAENRKSTQEIIGGVVDSNLCSIGSIIVGLFLVYISISVTVPSGTTSRCAHLERLHQIASSSRSRR